MFLVPVAHAYFDFFCLNSHDTPVLTTYGLGWMGVKEGAGAMKPGSLIKEFLVTCLLRTPGYQNRDKREPLSYWIDVKADLSLC